ncbi:MAG: hypothetical protein ACFFAS_00405 [Promethearchaeota archaeon]
MWFLFKYNDGKRNQDELNEINEELLLQLHERGIAAPSCTTLNDMYAIRVAITNHRSTRNDFNLLIDKIKYLIKQII